MIFRFTIPGDPVAKARPRVYRVNGFTRTVTPETTVRYEQHVRNCAMLAGAQPIDGALSATVQFWFALPASKARKRPVPQTHKTTKPDCDNLAKAVLDACNGVVYADDSQVARLTVEKYVAAQGEPSRCEVEIAQLTTEQQ